jgi:hypothetical protein
MDGIDIPFNLASKDMDDSIYLSSDDAKLVNGYTDSFGRVHRVPGYTELTTLDTGKYINGLFGYHDETKYKSLTRVYVSEGGVETSFPTTTSVKRVASIDAVWVVSNSRYFGCFYEDNQFKAVESVNNTPNQINGAIYNYENYDFRVYLTKIQKCNKNNPLKFIRTKSTLSDPNDFVLGGSYFLTGLDLVVFADGQHPPYIMSPIYYLQHPENIYYHTAHQFVKIIFDAEAPKPCSHVALINTYLIGNNILNGIFDISYPGYLDRWDGDFATASYRADNIVALLEVRHKLILFGAESAEIWINDGTSPFSPEYNHINKGTIAPYSVTNCDNVVYWLDEENRIVACDIAQGVTPTEVSTTLSKKINKSLYTYDCIGNYAKFRQERFYVADFPTQNKTFMVNTQSGSWSQLGRWNTRHNQYDAYGLLHHTYINSLGTIAGGRTNDTVYRVGEQYHTFNGDEIRTLIRTPVINHNTTDSKTVSRIEVLLERTMDKDIASITIDPMFMIRWRDDGRTNWQPWRRVSIDNLGRTSFFIEINRCGSYRTRQYEIVLLGDYPFCLTAMKEIHK